MHNIGLVLFHTGETKALVPLMLSLAKQPEKYKLTIVPVGISAKNILPNKLKKYIFIPKLIKNYLGQNDEDQMHFSDHYVKDILEKLENCQTVISGCPAKIQLQVIKVLPSNMQKIIYFDMPYNKKIAKKYAPYADFFIYTDNISMQLAHKDLANSIKILSARNGDFDTWLINHHKNLKNKKQIYAKLSIEPNAKLLLWIGGYNNPLEKKAFQKFAHAFKPYKNKFTLKIAIHPGLKSFNPQKTKRIINEYYISELTKIKYSKNAAQNTITSLDSNSIASIATAVISVDPTAVKQTSYIGIDAKTVYINKNSKIAGIEQIKTNAQWHEIFNFWLEDVNHILENKNFDIPTSSTEEVIIQII